MYVYFTMHMRKKQPGPLARPNAPTKKTQVFQKTTHTLFLVLVVLSIFSPDVGLWTRWQIAREKCCSFRSSEEELKCHKRRFGG